MKLEENVSLATLTTFHAGGVARFVATCTSVEEIQEALTFAKDNSLSWYALGEGSNVLPEDKGYDGLIIRVVIPGMKVEGNQLSAAAGVSWDAVVQEAAKHSLWGIENLAGIPGFMGAAPIQNIGAYGTEIRDVLKEVRVLNATTREVEVLTNTECEFSYRDSIFKRAPHLIVTEVTLELSKEPSPNITYGDLLKAKEEGRDLSTPEAIGKVVREIRSHKFPDLREYGTAGSFFKNPILSKEKYEELVGTYGAIPQFPNPGGIKIPLAFVLDKVLSLRGYTKGNAFLFGAQPLVLVLTRNGRAEEVEELAKEIEEKVFSTTEITIEREVRTLK